MPIQVLQELYIGKTPELKEIESIIHRVRNSHTENTFFTDPTYDKDISKINRIFEDFFGFEIFSLVIQRSSAANALTMPISSAIDIAPQYRVKKNLLATSKGFKYKKEAGYCCAVTIYNGLLFDDRFTDAEILAIILHEIGHNFESVINDTLYYTSDVVEVLNALVAFIQVALPSQGNMATIMGGITGVGIGKIITSNWFKKFNVKFTDFILKNDGLKSIFGIMSIIGDSINELENNILYVVSQVMKYGSLPRTVISVILSKIGRPTGKISENIADSFATVYGYGADLSSAVLKFDSFSVGTAVERGIMNIPVISQLMAIYDLPLDLFITAFNEHPTGIERTKMAKANLQRELKSAYLDPKMKIHIQNQIKDIDKALSKYESLSKNIENPKAFSALLNIFIYNVDVGDKKISKKSDKYMSNIDRIYNTVRLK